MSSAIALHAPILKRRRIVSYRDRQGLLFTIGGVGEASQNIVAGQVGKVCQNFLGGHTGGQVGEHIINGDPHSSDARFAATFTWFKDNDVSVVHGGQCLRSSLIVARFSMTPKIAPDGLIPKRRSK